MNKNKLNRKGFGFSFAWLFSIIVGAVIIFIAIFAVSSLISTSRTEIGAKTAAQLGVLLNPVETNLEEARYAVIEFPDETQFFNGCREEGNFGKQLISTSVRSGIGEKFQEPIVEISFFNKYIFSNEIEEGKKLYLLVKPLEMPYKVADMIFAYSGEYCFFNSPTEIENELSDLNAEKIKIVSDESECSLVSEVVCFDKIGCDIDVNTASEIVIKNGNELYYEGDLIYGAIFSEPEIYECQIQRLAKRAGELAHLYADKAEFISGKGCSTNLAGDLRIFASLNQVESSQELISIVIPAADNLEDRNGKLSCKLF